jgi:hypothetical protein
MLPQRVAVSPSPEATPPYFGRAAIGRRTPLDIVRILRAAAAITALMLLNLGGNAGAFVFFLILVGLVFRDPASAYKAMAICYLGLMINQAFVPKSLVWTPSRIAIPFLALARFSIDLSRLHVSLLTKKSYLALLLFTATMTVCSILSGWYTEIALLKLLNFWSSLTAIFAGVLVIRSQKIDMSEWCVSLIVTGSDEATTELFNGAFLHPNCHSLYASLFILFLASLFVLSPYRNRWLAIPAIAMWFGFMILSQSRTSAVAAVVPLVVLVGYARPRINKRGFRMRANAIAYDVNSNRKLTKFFVGFFNKGQIADSTSLDTEQILRSRRGLIEYSWNNFAENPIHGIGFQVAKTEFFVKNATLFSAPAEKGFLPTAMLEEGGILGAATFVIFLLVLFGGWIREHNIPAVVSFLGFLASNFGEVSIFSPGGSGAFGWIMVGFAAILGDHCWRRPAQHRPLVWDHMPAGR